MPDQNSSGQPPKPRTPPAPPVPSPPLPPILDPANKDKGAAAAKTPAAPVPSPPLPPIPPQKNAPAGSTEAPTPVEFKLKDGPPAPAQPTTQRTPEEEALIAGPAQAQTPAQAPTQVPAQARPQRRATSGGAPAGAQTAPQRPAGPPRGPRPGNAPPVPQPPLPGSAAAASAAASAPPVHSPHDDEFSSSGFDIRDLLVKAEPAAEWLFRVGLGLGALSLGFMLYAIFAGNIGQANVAPAMAGYIRLATTVFHWAMVLLAVGAIIIAFDLAALGIGLAVAGLVLHFGAPWVFSNHIGETNTTLAMVNSLRGTGSWLVVLGIIKASLDLVQWIIALPDRMKQRADVGVGRKAEAAQQRVARDANVFSPCWKLPFCRETIRKQCPAFLAKKTCWKFGRGCYCDEEMISRIIRGESLEVIKAPTRLSKTGKAPCGRCHIYLEHQGHKFKAMSPLTLPATAVIMYFIWPLWAKLFEAFSTSSIWDKLSFDTKAITPDAIATTTEIDTGGGLPAEQVMQVATVMFGVLIGFFVLIYVAKFIEWFVYKAKL